MKMTFTARCFIRRFPAGVLLAALPTLATSLPTEGLQVQFRSDTGRLTGAAGTLLPGGCVATWSTEDGVESPLTLGRDPSGNVGQPNWKANAFTRADGTVRPAVRFVRNDDNSADRVTPMRLTTAADGTTLNLGTSSTWFLVMNYLTDQQSQVSVFGFSDEPRFGAFVLGPDGGTDRLRLHNGSNPGASGVIAMTSGACLLDSRGDGSRMTSGVNGEERLNLAQTMSGRSVPARFGIGSMVGDVPYTARFDCGELVVYNRALKDAEVRIVRNALAARWGLTVENPLWAGAAGGFCEDLVGIGSSTAADAGRIPGAIETSGNSGGLSLAVASGALDGTDGYLLAAHDGGALRTSWSETDRCLRLTRIWRVETTCATAPATLLTFDLETVAPGVTGFSGRLLVRASAGDRFVDSGLSGTVSADGKKMSFAAPAGVCASGEFTLGVTGGTGAETAAPGTEDITVWFRPDVGVETDPETGAVTRWVNQGTLGAAADVCSSSGAVTRTESGLSFDGASFLMSADTTDLGRSGTEAPTWFAVYKAPKDRTELKDAGLFGLDGNDARFGAFFPMSQDGSQVCCYAGGYNVAVYAPVNGDAWQVLDTALYMMPNGNCRVYAGVNGCDVGNTGFAYRSVFAKLKVGHFRETGWGYPFKGEIAEIRVYNRTLNLVERLKVAQTLAARYGIAFDSPFLNQTHASGKTYTNGLSVAGCWDKGAFARTSPDCGGLVVDYPNWSDETARELWLAHDGGAPVWQPESDLLARSWFLRSDRPFESLRLTFLSGAVASEEAYALFYRSADTDDWIRMPVPVDVTAGVASVCVPAGLVTGYYTLGRISAGTAVPSIPCAGVRDGLAGWYRADTGVETAANGAVTAWRNLGLAGACADVFPLTGSASVSTTGFPRASGVGEASLVFPGATSLRSGGETKWLADTDNTWFVVFKLAEGARGDWGLFGNAGTRVNIAANRFGAFFTGGTGYPLRTHSFVANDVASYCTIPGSAFAIDRACHVDSRRYGQVVDTAVDGCFQEGKKSGSLLRAFSDQLLIGNCFNVTPFQGQLAELRVYNRALSDAERTLVTAHLALRYGVAAQGLPAYGGTADDQVLDLVGLGRTTSSTSTSEGTGSSATWTTHVAGSIPTSEWSAGFRLAAVGTLADGDYVLAGHGEKVNAWVRPSATLKRMKRAWHVTKTNAGSLGLTFEFDLAAAGLAAIEARERPDFGLVRSLDGQTWEMMDVDSVKTPAGHAFTLSAAEFAEGDYTLGANVTPNGAVIIFR